MPRGQGPDEAPVMLRVLMGWLANRLEGGEKATEAGCGGAGSYFPGFLHGC